TVHFGPGQDGRVREPAVAQDARLGRGGRDRGAQRLAAGAGVRQLAALMYRRILVPLEHSPADETILAHVRVLAQRLGSALVLIPMATHGHRLLEDVVRGSTATALRHITKVPVLMVRAEKK